MKLEIKAWRKHYEEWASDERNLKRGLPERATTGWHAIDNIEAMLEGKTILRQTITHNPFYERDDKYGPHWDGAKKLEASLIDANRRYRITRYEFKKLNYWEEKHWDLNNFISETLEKMGITNTEKKPWE